MDPKRWKKIETLYHSALGVDPGQRLAWLNEACDNEESIRLEVLSLLESAETSDSFLEEPVFDVAMGILISCEPETLVGTHLDRYELLEILGRGGMGEVYLAKDLRLLRRVALKLLPASIAEDRERVLRFEREARAASAVSHPNVAHIYEIGEADGRHYITMEYVTGRTLRAVLREKPLDIQTVINTAIHLAMALSAAHRAGVIHRDIKPENVIISENGFVKVLDFGLAKLTDRAADSNLDLLASIHTERELLMGTAHYMSPEQVRHQPLDLRTDLWSLGVVLFEMLTRRRPFEGQSFSQVIIAIVETEPQFTAVESRTVSPALQSILKRALQKDPADRYRTADEFLEDLQRLGEDAGPDRESGSPIQNAGRVDTVPQRFSTVIDETRPWQSRWDTLTSFARRSRAVPVALAMLLVFAVAGYFSFLHPRVTTLSSKNINLRFERLNLSGNISDISLSSDGKYVASIVSEGRTDSIHVAELSTHSDLLIVPPSDKRYSGLSFSPNNTYVYYLENSTETGTLYRVSKFGGATHKILANVNTAATFSPDGSRLAFVRLTSESDPGDLFIANTDGTNEQLVAQRTSNDEYRFSQDSYGPAPAWSPDGKWLACAAIKKSAENLSSLEIVDVETGNSHLLGSTSWNAISRFAWLADGSGLVLAAKESPTAPWQLSRVSYPNGESQQITKDPNNYTSLSATADSSAFLTLNIEDDANIWTVPVGQGTQFSPSIVGRRKGVTEVTSTGDGKLLYVLYDGVKSNVWRQDADGTNAEQLTFEAHTDFRPAASPKQDYIVFVSEREGGNLNVWRMDFHGANLKQLTSGPYEDQPSITPDGLWVVYRTEGEIWKVSIDGQNATRLFAKGSLNPVVSPDGNKLAFFTKDKLDSERWHLEIRNFQTLALVKRLELPEATDPFVGLRWTPKGNGLTYVSSADGNSNLWIQLIDDPTPKRLTDFRDAEIQSFTWSTDGRQMVCVRRLKTYIPVIVSIF